MLKRALFLTMPILLASAPPVGAQMPGIAVILKLENRATYDSIVTFRNASTGWTSPDLALAVHKSGEIRYDGWPPDLYPTQDFVASMTAQGRACTVGFRARMTIPVPVGGATNDLTVENITKNETRLTCNVDFTCTPVDTDATNASCTVTVVFQSYD